MVKEGQELDIYRINTKAKFDRNKKIIILLILLSLILVILVAINISKMINSYNVYKGYESQIISLKQQEEKRQEELEKAINEEITSKGLELFVLAITDILNSNSKRKSKASIKEKYQMI